MEDRYQPAQCMSANAKPVKRSGQHLKNTAQKAAECHTSFPHVCFMFPLTSGKEFVCDAFLAIAMGACCITCSVPPSIFTDQDEPGALGSCSTVYASLCLTAPCAGSFITPTLPAAAEKVCAVEGVDGMVCAVAVR